MSTLANTLLNKPVKVLDNGYVIPIDFMGSDLRIVQAARVSTGLDEKDANEKGNRKLINYLMKNSHTSPFEMVHLVWKLRLPIFVMRQLIRHRTANVNEMSGRYTDLPTDFYFPENNKINKQSTSNKQGRLDEEFYGVELTYVKQQMENSFEASESVYSNLLGSDVARELARIVLPVATYTEAYWQIDLHNLFHFLKLRLDAHAQYEIRVYAEAMAEFAKAVAPIAYSAFEEYVLYAKTFSHSEVIKMNLNN